MAGRVRRGLPFTALPDGDAYVESRRFRRESWFLDPAGHVELCNVAIPVRERKSAPKID